MKGAQSHDQSNEGDPWYPANEVMMEEIWELLRDVATVIR